MPNVWRATSCGTAVGYSLPDLVTRDQVFGYPTNFAAMSEENINLLSQRGEQLTRMLLAYYCPEL